jgi:biotin carboxylase
MNVPKAPFLILAGGLYQLPLIHAARRRGYQVALFDADPDSPGFKFAEFPEVVDISDADAVILAARRLAPSGIASIVNEVAVKTTAITAATLGIPGIGIEAAEACTDKFIMRNRFKQSGIPTPRFGVITRIGDATNVANSIGFPVVVKPVDNSGSRGVRRVEGIYDLEAAVELAMSHSRKRRVIIEEFLEGTEYTVETFTVNDHTEILGLSEKTRVPFPHCVSINLTYTPIATVTKGTDIVSAAKQAVDALGLHNGPAHIEVMLTKSGPFVVEVAARGGGYRIFSEILPSISGIDPIEAVIDQAIGLVPSIRPLYQKAAVLRFLNPQMTGIIQSVSGVAEARQVANVLDVVIEATPGKLFRGITRDGERPGYIITTADSPEKAILAADQAEQKVIFNIKSDPIDTGEHLQ